MLGLTKPKRTILGYELAGEIEAVGSAVTLFEVGDQVFGTTTGLKAGGYAEYTCVPEAKVLALKPSNLSYAEAAALPIGGLTALHFLRKGNIESSQNEQKVLIYGASGSVETFAVQLAKHFGAEVTAVVSTSNVELLKSLGADHVIDYTKQDFTSNGQTYDIIFDTVGKLSFSYSKRSLKPQGVYLSVEMTVSLLFSMLWSAIRGKAGKRVISGVSSERNKDLNFLKELSESGTIKAVIDRRFSLPQIPQAHTYVDAGHKKGSVVVIVNTSSELAHLQNQAGQNVSSGATAVEVKVTT
jgi:NADPH:quinone reductase-like Zn-dependent oxidoreductase